mmetsp:Transcript_13795/g.20906  ORF Transcript_13795/g.20906 Transcript_13795/m.20906 type:complete len:268 (+) Transcript_13795:53-856(+)
MDRQTNNGVTIVDVWKDNLDEELLYISGLIKEYPYIAMDTEFPGVVVKPILSKLTSPEYAYQNIRLNCNLMKLIQLGLTFSDEEGHFPPDGRCIFQFNFQFNELSDINAQKSINLLKKSGLNFDMHRDRGIDPLEFAEKFTMSGLVLSKEVRWVAFHASYDFGYLIKVMTNQPLPEDSDDFFQMIEFYFPYLYDTKFLMKSCKELSGGLDSLADAMKVTRIGTAHQAGSDSALTLKSFIALMSNYFEDNFDDEKYIGHIYGLKGIER